MTTRARRATMPAVPVVKASNDYEKPDDFLGGSGGGTAAPKKTSKKSSLGTNTSGLDKPEFFLGGCDNEPKKHKMKMRASWLQPSGDDAAESLKKLLAHDSADQHKHVHHNAMNASVPAIKTSMRDLHMSDSEDDEDKTKTTASSSGSYQKPDDFMGGSESGLSTRKKWTPPPKGDDDDASPKATHGASAYAQESFLPGSEPKEIKKWKPPKKEEPHTKP